MKALVFQGPFKVTVEDAEDPKIEEPGDAVIRVTTANICGSDLHLCHGRAPLQGGMVLGHENMDIVEETGPGVNRVKAGDRVSVPFNLACGTCRNCRNCRNCDEGWTSTCLRANPSGQPGAGYWYPQDFTTLSDIFPTGCHGTELAGPGPGGPWPSSAPGRPT